MAINRRKKNGEGFKPVDYEISMTSLVLRFFNEKRDRLNVSYEEMAKYIGLSYATLHSFLNNQSNFYLVHNINFFIIESMRDYLSPRISDLHRSICINKDSVPQSPFFLEKMNYLSAISKELGDEIMSEMQFYELLRYKYDFDNNSIPKTITELLNMYGSSFV